ncbi:MAG TPA: pyrroline-5-carboxylate reductase [Oligoflexia bacterium]|nr:pyrroline-5-carboxylate reductase [Oligoflexia bacterium]
MANTIGILGLGKMGEALVRGMLDAGVAKNRILGTTGRAKSAAEASKRLGIKVFTDNQKLIEKCDVIFLSVKPQHVEAVLNENSKSLTKKKLLVSVCASITTSQLESWSGGRCAVVRSMPNTPCLIGEGVTAIASSATSKPSDLKLVSELFETVGKVVVLDESLMDGATGLSGCGPAYVYLVIEALSEAGVKVGLPRKTATLLAAQTLVGAAKMVLERGEHPAALKDEVTTPAGCTIDGLMALEAGGLRVTLINAVMAAAERSTKLSR